MEKKTRYGKVEIYENDRNGTIKTIFNNCTLQLTGNYIIIGEDEHTIINDKETTLITHTIKDLSTIKNYKTYFPNYVGKEIITD